MVLVLSIFCAAKSHQANPMFRHAHVLMQRVTHPCSISHCMEPRKGPRTADYNLWFWTISSLPIWCPLGFHNFLPARHGSCELGKTEDALAKLRREHIKRRAMTSALEDGKEWIKISHSDLFICGSYNGNVHPEPVVFPEWVSGVQGMDHLTLKQMQGAELCLCCTEVARPRGGPKPGACPALITLILAWRLTCRKTFWVSCLARSDAGHHSRYMGKAKPEMACLHYRVIPAGGCPKAPQLYEA